MSGISGGLSRGSLFQTGYTGYSSAERVSGTTYQNTSGSPRFVLVSHDIGATQSILVNIDSVTPAADRKIEVTLPAGIAATFSVAFIVGPGQYYSVTCPGTLKHWFETVL